METPSRSLRSLLIGLALVAAGLALNIHQAAAVGMDRVMPLWVVDAIPVALADLKFNHKGDYTGLAQVRGLFHENLRDHSTAALDDGIRLVLQRRRSVEDRSTYLAGSDDKGIIDFVKTAFRCFGLHSGRILWLYWLVLGVSGTAFVLRFHLQPGALLLLLCFFLGHYAVLPVVAVNPQLRSVLALRFLSVLGMLATLHLVLEVFSNQRLSRLAAFTLVVQALIVVAGLHIRFAAVWQVVCIMAACLLRGAVVLYQRRRGLASVPLGHVFLPGLAVLLSMAALSGYRAARYAPDYAAQGGAGHVFWHSVYSGLAFHPELAAEQQLRIDDWSVYAAAGRYLCARGRDAEWQAMGGSTLRYPDRCTLHFDQYDTVVREMFLAVCRERPGTVAASVLYYKPRALLETAAWYGGFLDDYPGLPLLWPEAVAEFETMNAALAAGQRYDPLRWECLLALLAFTWWGGAALRRDLRSLTPALLLFAVASTFPGLLGYPTPHTVSDALIALAMLLQVGAVTTVVLGAAAIQRRWTRTHATSEGAPSNGRLVGEAA